jgi:hypothetical protein
MEHQITDKRTFRQFFFSNTSWVVWLAILLTAAMMFLQKVLGNDTLLPHETMAWGLTVIAGGYTGMDRFAMAIKSKTLEYGEADLGDPKKLRWVIICLFALVIEALLLQVFQNVRGLALETLIVAFSAAGGAYVVGNKAITAAAYIPGAAAPTTVSGGGQNVPGTPSNTPAA